jgi:hypothetical protein
MKILRSVIRQIIAEGNAVPPEETMDVWKGYPQSERSDYEKFLSEKAYPYIDNAKPWLAYTVVLKILENLRFNRGEIKLNPRKVLDFEYLLGQLRSSDILYGRGSTPGIFQEILGIVPPVDVGDYENSVHKLAARAFIDAIGALGLPTDRLNSEFFQSISNSDLIPKLNDSIYKLSSPNMRPSDSFDKIKRAELTGDLDRISAVFMQKRKQAY